MLEDNLDPDFRVDDEVNDLLSSGIEDNDNGDDGDGGDDDNDGDGGNVGNRVEARFNKEQVQDQLINDEVVQDSEADVDNIQVESQESHVTDERVKVKNLTENVDKIVEDEVIVEKEQVEMEFDNITPEAKANTTKKRKEPEKDVPSRPPPSKGIVIKSLHD
ncbi:hypothetical protein L1987_60142 [Smallanthus sonchifolius]|uniref:Uncharacterized protein n=1 Tax=Smallanthus sonchifolius TaxID=185202 RepID=A0ACB9D782_9ASTR|nr:hypothetical protein L1987_60142 [Smallanthus sonchifolius]